MLTYCRFAGRRRERNHVALLGAMDHCVATLTSCRIVEIPRAVIEEVAQSYPRIATGLWWATLVDEAVLREWLVSMGQRNSNRRMAHFYCEMLVRLSIVGLVENNSYDLPLTQHEMADTLGLSVVHINRTLQELRSTVLEAHGRKISIPDVDRLFAYAGFNPNYLHLTKRNSLVA